MTEKSDSDIENTLKRLKRYKRHGIISIVLAITGMIFLVWLGISIFPKISPTKHFNPEFVYLYAAIQQANGFTFALCLIGLGCIMALLGVMCCQSYSMHSLFEEICNHLKKHDSNIDRKIE